MEARLFQLSSPAETHLPIPAFPPLPEPPILLNSGVWKRETPRESEMVSATVKIEKLWGGQTRLRGHL